MLCLRVILLLLFSTPGLALSSSQTENDSPVTKVVELIKALKEKIEADGRNEQAVFDKFACWCEETTDRKAQAITSAMEEIKRLGVMVLSLKGTVATRDFEMTELKGLIRDNDKSQEEATMMREKANAAFVAEKAEMEDTIGALERGILALQGAGTHSSFLQAHATTKVAAEIINKAVRSLPSDSYLTPKQLHELNVFMQASTTSTASYAPQSGTIVGILKDMYDTFSSNNEKGVRTEADQVFAYEGLMAIKTKEHATLTEELRARTQEHAEAQAMAAAASQELSDTTNQMIADTQFFDKTKAACTTKADEWSERVRARTEELHGIDKAVGILDSDDAKALFADAIKPGKETSFLQFNAEQSHEPRTKAFHVLKSAAKTTGSLRLAALASRVRTASAGHFKEVTEQIDKMRDVLKQEEKDDFDQRDWCKEETFKNEQERDRFAYKVDKANQEIQKLEDKLESLESVLSHTSDEISDTMQEIEEMEETRQSEHDAFQNAKADDEGAVALLEKAIESLGSFYKGNKHEMGEIQGSAKLLQQPEQSGFEDKDRMPDTTFTDAGKSKGESKGIIGILTMLKEDLQDEIKNGVKNEVQAQTDYEQALGKANAALKSLRSKAVDLRGAIAVTNSAIDENNQAKENNENSLEEEKEYLASIKPDCDWLYENFDTRRAKRNEEVEGLIEAKGMLAGNAPPPPAGSAWTAPAL